MLMNAAIFSFIVFLIISCNQPASIQQKKSFKDSVVKQFFSIVDSLDSYDTTTYDFKMLKAYVNDDTVFFKKAKADLDRHVDYYSFNMIDSSIVPKKLSDLPVDEAYRFIHSQCFCDFGQTVTISRSGDSIKLNYLEYIIGDPDGVKSDYVHNNGTHYVVDSNCVIIKHFDRSLKLADWQKLKDALYKTDYWGLKPTSPRMLLDPSHWQVDAYTKQPAFPINQKVYSVKREFPPFKEFGDLCILFMKLSGEKGMCEPFD
jgi:hypothetical protein